MPVETAQQWFGQGNLLYREKELQGAAECYRQALRIDPGFADASFNLGCTLDALVGPQEALPHFAMAAQLRPDWCEAHGNLGLALARTGRMAEACAELATAATLNPADAGIRNNLGLALGAQGNGEEACASFQQAIRLNPLYAEAHNNLANLLERYGRTSEAITGFLTALKLRPDYPEAHNNLACALKSQGRHGEAIAHFREALRLRPEYSEAHSSLLFSLCYPAGLREEELAAEHRAFGSAHAFAAEPHDNEPSPDRIISIGYVSADFRSHAVARFIEPVLRHHDRSRFRICCYSNVSVRDVVTDSLERLADRFISIAGMPDEAACAAIRGDGVDILVDLSGHTADNRLLLFARKPAPVQVTWLGYPHSTGLSSMDYRFTDAVSDPPGATDRFHSEKLVRLPRNFSCFGPPANAPEVTALPSLSKGVTTFGSFNNPAKITRETVALWARALQAVPGSRMLVKGYSLADAGSRELLVSRFSEHDIAAERLELAGNTATYHEHLALYGRVDIALDTFPYNGTTTTCEALWMGVPVVTLAGDTHRSRVGASILANVGLAELVVGDEREYGQVAGALARDLDRLGKLRRSLRPLMASSSLTDGAGFTRELETAFSEIWSRWCAEEGTFPLAPLCEREAPGIPSEPPLPVPPLIKGGRGGLPLSLPQRNLDSALRHLLSRLNSGSDSVLGGVQELLNRQMTAEMVEALNRDLLNAGAAPLPLDGGKMGEETLEETAQQLLARGLVTPADLICRYLHDRGHRSQTVSRTLGDIALAIGETHSAAIHFREAMATGDCSTATAIRRVKAEETCRLLREPAKRERFLLIKAWGYGFWSDIFHVLGQLLLAEMTGRIPVVHWGGNSLFSDDPHANAFEMFFEPVSRFTLEELTRETRSIYPPKWNASNLASDRLNQADGPWSRCSSLHALERREDVVVSDFHYAVNDLVPWIHPGHRLYGLAADQVCLDLFCRYLKVKPRIAAKADSFFKERMSGQFHLGVHVRGGDKSGEEVNLDTLNALYHPEIERYLRDQPQARLFLMTDDEGILADYRHRYGERVITTGATRTGNAAGVHYQNHPSRYLLGEEVLVDSLLALRCAAFIGNGLSNVSCAVAQMKEWGPGNLKLLGARLDRTRNITLYRS